MADSQVARYCRSRQDHAALKLVIKFRKLGYRTAHIGPRDLPIPRVSPEYVFGSLGRRQMQEFSHTPGKAPGPEWDRYKAAMSRLFYYSIPRKR